MAMLTKIQVVSDFLKTAYPIIEKVNTHQRALTTAKLTPNHLLINRKETMAPIVRLMSDDIVNNFFILFFYNLIGGNRIFGKNMENI